MGDIYLGDKNKLGLFQILDAFKRQELKKVFFVLDSCVVSFAPKANFSKRASLDLIGKNPQMIL